MTGYLTVDETAELLRVSAGHVRRLARREGLPLIRLSQRRYLVSQEGLATWLDARLVGNGAQVPATGQPGATGASPSRFPRMADDDARSGSTGRRRPPVASLRRSSVVSLADSRPRRAG